MLRAIREYPSTRLRHIVSAHREPNKIVIYYRPYALGVRRPDQGSSVTDVRCGACHAEVRLRVHSIERTKRARRRWLAMAALGLLLCAGVTYEALRPNSFILQSETAALALTSVVVSVVSLGFAVAGAVLWWVEDGVRLTSQPKQGPMVSVDSTSCRAHQHAAGARRNPPRVPGKDARPGSTVPTRDSDAPGAA